MPVRRPLDPPEYLDLGLEGDAEALADAATTLGHQRDHVGGRRLAGVLDEVRVLLGEARAPDPQPAAAGRLEELTGGALGGGRVIGGLEGRSEGLDPRRLRLAPAVSHPGEGGADRSRLARLEPERGPRDDLAGLEV